MVSMYHSFPILNVEIRMSLSLSGLGHTVASMASSNTTVAVAVAVDSSSDYNMAVDSGSASIPVDCVSHTASLSHDMGDVFVCLHSLIARNSQRT